eukprot:7502608-Pyramimonas_sp.AAC.1
MSGPFSAAASQPGPPLSLARTAGAREKHAGAPAPEDSTSVIGLSGQARAAVARACPRHSFSNDGGVQMPAP